MKKTLSVLWVLSLLAGCSSGSVTVNEPPEARIVSMPSVAVAEGERVAFAGEGIDRDGEVVGYLWRSNRDGELSRLARFETDALSAGEHVVYLKVQDNNGEWSAEVSGLVSVVAAPKVKAFIASASAVQAGERVTLSWEVSGATSVTLSPGVGVVPQAGMVEVTPDQTTTYVLTATRDGFTTTAEVAVAVERLVQRVTLVADGGLSGYVRQSGVFRTMGMYVGDDDSNRGFQGFLTYDMTRIPEGATITTVVVDLSEYEIPYSPPFPHLGCLGAYVQEYGTLYGAYWLDDLPAPIGAWCSLDELDSPAAEDGFRAELQKTVGRELFQFRLQFADRSEGDDTRDLLHWERYGLPTLTVEYIVSR